MGKLNCDELQPDRVDVFLRAPLAARFMSGHRAQLHPTTTRVRGENPRLSC